MKKLFVIVLATIGMVSCMNTDEVIEVNNGDQIAFADAFIDNATRAAVDGTYNNDTNALEAFNVYGTVNAGGSVANIFNAVPVTNNGGVWSYDPQYTQYWVKGVTYDFVALVHGDAELDSNKMPVAIDYDITSQDDLLYAEQKGVTYNGGEAKTVDFTFSHLLSKVKFTFENTITATDAYSYVVEDVKVEASKSATYDLENKAWGNYAEKTAVEFGGAEATLTSAAKAESQNEQLLIPSAESKKITFTLKLMLGGVELSSEVKTIETDLELVAGNAYNFVVALGEPGEKIEFTAKVTDWVTVSEELDVDYSFDGQNYLVASAEGLKALAEKEDILDANIVLTGDIDLADVATRSYVSGNWAPIGTPEAPFTGTFDGKGYSIKNLNLVVEEAKEGKAYIGFFGYAEDAEIKNVTFENVNVNIACLDIDHSQGHIGAVAGSLEGNSTIENVTVKGNIFVEATTTANGASRVAVVAGGNTYGNVTMKNVHVKANEGSYLKANNNVGALAGQLQDKSVFENCSSNIDVTGTKFFAGGIIGLAAGDQLFTNCHTTGDVTITAGRSGRAHDHYRVGGIAGGWADGKNNVCTLTDCSYTGKLSGTNADGSVAEKFDYLGYVGRGYTLNNCAGSKVVIDGVSFVQIGNTAAEAGVYEVTNAAGEKVEAVGSKEDLPKTEGGKIDTDFTENVELFGDITVSANETSANSGYGATGIKVADGAVLDGHGNKLTVNDAWATWDCVANIAGGTIKNLTVSSAMRGIFMGGATTDVYIDNVIFDNVIYTFNSDGGNKNYGVYISNSTLNGWTSHSDVHKEVVYTNCKFGKGNGYAFCRPYGPTSFVNCDFEAGFQVDAIGALTFQNCTVGGVALTAENLATLVVDGIDNVNLLVSTVDELVAALAKEGEGNIYLAEGFVVEGQKVTLDLNGKTIVAEKSSAITAKDGAVVTIEGEGKVIAYEAVVRAIGGEVIVNGGEFTSTGTALDTPSTYRYSVDSREGGKITINGGTFKSNNGMINVSSEVVINGGKFENVVEKAMTRHFAYVSAPLTINGGEFKGVANGAAGGCFFCGAAAGCDIQINGGKFTSLWTSGKVNRIFEVYYGGTINVTGGMFNTNGGINNFVVANTDDATKDAYPYVAK